MNYFARLGLISFALVLSACSVFESEKIDYKSAAKAPTLEIPPDLTQLNSDSRYAVANSSVSANHYEASRPLSQSDNATTAINAVGDIHIERAGSQRWLVVDRPADALWQPIRDFWHENGFTLTLEQSELGILETDWAENRAKLPQDIIRKTVGKLFDSLYSTSERDRFRTRLERNAKGGTEIFISHRGMVEIYRDTSTKEQTIWQPRPADPELEAEFLRRLMLKLGVSEAKSTELLAQAKSIAPTSHVKTQDDGTPFIEVSENFDIAWRRVGLALDRSDFTVEDRDRSKGLYFVRYIPPETNKKEKGFFGKMFGSDDSIEPLKLQILVNSLAVGTQVVVQNKDGVAQKSADAQRILKLISNDLN